MNNGYILISVLLPVVIFGGFWILTKILDIVEKLLKKLLTI